MPRYLLDTEHLTLYLHGHSSVTRQVKSQLAAAAGISVVTVEEVLRGRLAKIRRAGDGPTRIRSYARLERSLRDLGQFPTVPYDQSAEDEFQRLHSIRIGSQDFKIASIAMANNLIEVTRIRRHFGLVPGLTIEDWSI